MVFNGRVISTLNPCFYFSHPESSHCCSFGLFLLSMDVLTLSLDTESGFEEQMGDRKVLDVV
jgi:hypothetical protein